MSYRPSHQHSLLTLAIVLVVAATVPAAVHGAAPPIDPPPADPAAVVYWIGLRPSAAAGLNGIAAAYDQIQPLLRQLRAQGRVLGFQLHPDRGAVRVVAVSSGVDGLATRPEVKEIEADGYIRIEGPHPHAPERPWPAEEVIRWQAQAQSVVPAQTYAIRGPVRDHAWTAVEDAYVSTGYADPAYAGDWTDAGGAYTLTVSAAGTYHVSAHKPGYPDSDGRAVTVPPDAVGIELTFPPTYTISGVVRDRAGNPVSGAQVYGGIDTVTTAGDGTFTAVAGPGEHDLSAYKDGYQSPYDVLVPLPPTATGVGVPLLREDGMIQGRIVNDQGAPVAGAWVYAENAVCGDWGDGAAQTTAGGDYSLSVPAGIYHVWASKDGHVPTAPQQVDVPSGLPAVQANLVLDRALVTIRGTVRDGAGQPVENAQVNASACGLSYGTSTNAGGAYTLTVGEGLYTVSATKTDYTGGNIQMVSVPPDATGIDFSLTALTFYTITGRVTTPQGQPIEGAWVETFSIGYFGLWGNGGYVDASDNVVIMGAGPVGLSALMVAKTAKARTIMIEPLKSRRDTALKFGADEVVDPSAGNLKEAVTKLTGGQGVSVVVEASGNDKAIASIFDIAGNSARVRLIGHSVGHKVPNEIGLTIWKTLAITGSGGTRNFGQRTIRFMDRMRDTFDVTKLITHRFPFAKIHEAFQVAAVQKQTALKVMLTF